MYRQSWLKLSFPRNFVWKTMEWYLNQLGRWKESMWWRWRVHRESTDRRIDQRYIDENYPITVVVNKLEGQVTSRLTPNKTGTFSWHIVPVTLPGKLSMVLADDRIGAPRPLYRVFDDDTVDDWNNSGLAAMNALRSVEPSVFDVMNGTFRVIRYFPAFSFNPSCAKWTSGHSESVQRMLFSLTCTQTNGK